MAETPNFDIFDLGLEDLDSLRLEAQSVTPNEEQEIEELVAELHKEFLRQMSAFLAFDLSPESVLKKFITTDKETYIEFNRAWEIPVLSRQRYTEDEQSDARAFIDEGNFVMGVPPQLWRYIAEEDWQSMLAKFDITHEELKKRLIRSQRSQTILHEITHLHQLDSNLTPLWLLEAQAYWVARDYFATPLTVPIVGFFQSLLDKYGDEVHELCFGKSQNLQLAASIKSEFTPEIQAKAFPGYCE